MTEEKVKKLVKAIEERREIVAKEYYSSTDVRLHLLGDLVWILKEMLK